MSRFPLGWFAAAVVVAVPFTATAQDAETPVIDGPTEVASPPETTAPPASGTAAPRGTRRTPVAEAAGSTPRAPAPGETEARIARPGGPGEVPARPTNREPFGGGTKVQVTSSDIVDVYVARGSEQYEDLPLEEFVKIGKTPVSFELPPGLYTLEVESPDVTRGSMVLEMGPDPRNIIARTGKAELGVLGSMSLAIGITATLTGIVTLAVFSDKPDLDSREGKIALPLLIGGGVLTLGGVAMFVASRTSLEDGTPGGTPHAGRAVQLGRGPRGLIVGGSASF